jgi:hypothetical protein
MPKKYARIWLEITDIRVERVNNISDEEAKKEGIIVKDPENYNAFMTPYRHLFFKLWDSIYNNWSSNPWVWVIEFKVVDK